ncbi:MAG: LiaF-related protein [Candidatus Dojkabacteria bacterium]|nr:LiaF-related protein [Candidatus Dojkabacteria bacterium]
MKNNLTKIVIGGILITIGGFFFLRTAGVIPYLGIDIWYILGFLFPAILLFFGIKMLIESNTTPGIILIAIALVFFLTHIFDWGFFSILWPVIIIAIGVSIFVKRDKSPECCDLNSSSKTDEKDEIKDTILFWGVEKAVSSKNFKNANIDVAFGGYTIDLTKAKIVKSGAQIIVNVAFGGVTIIVPKEYKIVSEGTGVFGGWENKIDNKGRKAPTITIKGTAIFAGVEIKEKS